MSISENLSRLYPTLMQLGTAHATVYITGHEVSIQVHGSGLTDHERVLRWRGVLDVLTQPWKFHAMYYDNGGGNVSAYVAVNEVPFRVWVGFDDIDSITDHLPISTQGLRVAS